MTGDYINKQAQQERDNAIETDSNKWLVPFAAGLGVIGLGSFLLKKRIATGGGLMDHMFNFLGLPKGISLSSDIAANSGKSTSRSNTSGIRSISDASFDVNKNRLNIGPIDLIDDLRNSVEIIGNADIDRSIGTHVASRTTEFVNREIASQGTNTGYFTKDLQRVTFGQVIKDQAAWSRVIGKEQVDIISRSRSYGLVKSNMAIDKNIFFNPATNEVLDFRARNLFSSVHEVKTASGSIFERRSKFDLFGQGKVIDSILGVRNRKIALIGPGDGYKGSRVFIDGTAYGYKFNQATGMYDEAIHGTNKTLRRTGDTLEVIAASRQGRIEISTPPRKGVGSVVGWAEKNLGIGPAFSNRASFVEKLAVHPYKRFRALQTGEGVIFKHPYQRFGASSNAVDAVFGGASPEMASLGGRIMPVPGGGVAVGIEGLKGNTQIVMPKRIGVFFNLLDNHSVVTKRGYQKYSTGATNRVSGSDFIAPPKKGGYKITGQNIPEGSIANNITDISRSDLTAAGFPSSSNKYGYYTVDKTLGSSTLSGLKDFAAYGLYRVNNLASETAFGIGFAPSHKITTNLARLGGVAVAYQTANQLIQYGDYLTERITGVSPIKAVASAYAGARLAQQKIRETVGIQQAADFLDTYFPGSINSEGSTIARSLLAPMYAASYFLSKGKFGKAIGAAGAVYGAIGGSEPDQSTADLQREYTGDKKVAVRKGAFWGMGYTPFFGGEVDYYSSGWYAKLMSGYRNKSIYGSDQEYWSYHANVFGVPLPTPSNLFGLNNILNPYRLEEMNYSSRPYIQTSSQLSNFPIIGTALGATLGELMKPTVYRQPDQMPLLKAGLAGPGLTPSMATMMGIPAMNATAQEAESPNTITNLIARQANIATEPLGVYKFAMEFFGVSTKPKMGTEYATSATIGDPGRELFDGSVAGAFGQTELLRRFMLGDYSAQHRRAAAINPIKNNMPDWLPGTFSSAPNDRDYFVDFTMGDPFAKIRDGESRLPGVGYEALNELHSGRKGEYSDVDKFLILSDVAPYSSAYSEYEARVTGMGLEGRWATKVEEAKEQRRQAVGVDDRYKRYEEDLIALNMNTIAKAAYAPIRKAYDFLTHDVLAEIPYLGSKIFPFRSPYEQYRKTHVEGAEYASWDKPYEDILRPIVYDTALEDPLTAAGKGAVLGALISGPMRWFSPIKGIVGAPGHTVNMSSIIGGAAIGGGVSSARIMAGYDQDMIPGHIEDESDAISYMDKVAYIKGRIIQEAGGGSRAANRTMVGAKMSVDFRAALPRSSDKRYFDYFTSQEDEDVRSQIKGGLPYYMREGVERTWNQSFNSLSDSDMETLAFLDNNEIPDSDWAGWNPAVSASAAKLKLIQHGVNGISSDIHRFGFFESHEIDLKTRLKELNSQSINFVQSPMHASLDQFLKDQSKGMKKASYRINSASTPLGSRRDMTIYRDNDHNLIEQMRAR